MRNAVHPLGPRKTTVSGSTYRVARSNVTAFIPAYRSSGTVSRTTAKFWL